MNFLTQSNKKIQKINFFIHFDTRFMILCPYDLFHNNVERTQVKYQVHLVNKQVPTFAKLEMISLPSTLA